LPRPLLENAMTFQIDKDLPIPKITTGRPRIYPFPTMEVGDSFVVPITNEMESGQDKSSRLLRSAASAYSRRYGSKFSVQFQRSNKVTRCWRIE
jgi:hypothetical protein